MMDRAEYEAQLNHTGELHDIEPQEEPDAATAYVRAVFDGYARRQAALRASRDMEAIRRSNDNTQTLLKALGWGDVA